MRRAFEWSTVIETWRTAHGGQQDVPDLRQIIVDLAAHTSRLRHEDRRRPTATGPSPSRASTGYLMAKGQAIDAYVNTTEPPSSCDPLEDGMGAIVALLVAGVVTTTNEARSLIAVLLVALAAVLAGSWCVAG